MQHFRVNITLSHAIFFLSFINPEITINKAIIIRLYKWEKRLWEWLFELRSGLSLELKTVDPSGLPTPKGGLSREQSYQTCFLSSPALPFFLKDFRRPYDRVTLDNGEERRRKFFKRTQNPDGKPDRAPWLSYLLPYHPQNLVFMSSQLSGPGSLPATALRQFWMWN